MVWLFGQIWLWLIVAFALGAVSAWLVLRTQHTAPEPTREPEPYYEPTPRDEAEQTQFIPAANFQPTEESRYDEDTPEPAGHREGHLPLPPQRGAQDEYWPAEEEPVWPEADDLPDATHQWPQAPHQPGRGA
ncbi:hypothetical protein [Amycolatopsis sp. NBC_01286]|uniref:hypothetical protein n=1 Tax=Amycolatopsis sp. NBC_01286 TaxID=2903560 RepID=UPI002E0F9DDB|nr:hypothetical protein OG570_15485 [Amycolatopsis sp. NBC_01286]